MRNFVFFAVAASFGLTACNSSEEAAEVPAADQAIAAEDPAGDVALSADGLPTPGTYHATDADGVVMTEIVNADGTFTWSLEDGTTGGGTWRNDGPDVFCTTDTGQEEVCYDESIDAEGVWTSVPRSDPAQVYIIERVEG